MGSPECAPSWATSASATGATGKVSAQPFTRLLPHRCPGHGGTLAVQIQPRNTAVQGRGYLLAVHSYSIGRKEDLGPWLVS